MVSPTSPQFLIDESGRRVAVLVGIEQYRALLDAREELEDLHAYDEAKASGDEAIPFDEALLDIERGRREA